MIIPQHEAIVLPGRIISNKDYHADTDNVTKSGLDLIDRSPLHFWAAKLDPKREKPEETEALIVGRAIHTAALEYSEFNNEFVVSPGFDRRTTIGKEKYAEFMATHAGKGILDLDQYRLVMNIRESILNHPLAKRLLTSGFVENTYYWTDEDTGVKCKCRPDFLNKLGIGVDIKSTEDASPENFGRSAAKYRYPVQGAYYTDGLEANGIYLESFVFIAVEKKPPYAVACYELPVRGYDLGRQQYRANLRTYSEAKQSNIWPGYSDIITDLQIPGWAFK